MLIYLCGLWIWFLGLEVKDFKKRRVRIRKMIKIGVGFMV